MTVKKETGHFMSACFGLDYVLLDISHSNGSSYPDIYTFNNEQIWITRVHNQPLDNLSCIIIMPAATKFLVKC